MAFLLIGVVLILGLLLLRYFLQTLKLKNFPPGPPRLPLVGSLPYMPGELIHLHADKHWRHKYGPVVGLLAGTQPVMVVCGAEEVLTVLNHKLCQMRPPIFLATERAFGKRLGLMFSDGPYWAEQRRFTLRQLRDLGLGKSKLESVILDEVKDTLNVIQKSGAKTEPNTLFNAPVINMIWYMVSGRQFTGAAGDKTPRLLDMLNRSMRTKKLATAPCDFWPFLRHIAPNWSGYNDIYPPIFEIQKFLRDEIKSQRLEGISESFMAQYLTELDKPQHDSSYSEESLITVCLDLFTAGGESVANTLSFALLYMALYPEKQAKVHAELEALGRDPTDLIVSEDKPSLPFVEATLVEVMRTNTIAPLAIPHSCPEDVEISGYTVPKDTVMLLSLWSVLHDEKHWGDPEEFRPERFIDASGKYVKDPWMVQFGQGKRVCVGESFAYQASFLFFANLVNRFKYSLPPGSERPSTVPVPGITVCPQDFTVVATPRK